MTLLLKKNKNKKTKKTKTKQNKKNSGQLEKSKVNQS